MSFYPISIEAVSELIHERNIRYGFKEAGEPRNPTEVTMLIISELAEAFEELRKGHAPNYRYFSCGKSGTADFHEVHLQPDVLPIWCAYPVEVYGCPEHGKPLKPEGFGVEYADAMIRLLDAAPEFGLNYDYLIPHKMAFNDTREPKHGKTM